MVVGVWIVGWADILHFVYAAALGAALDGAAAGELRVLDVVLSVHIGGGLACMRGSLVKCVGLSEEGWTGLDATYCTPLHNVRVCGTACATNVLLVAGGLDADGILHRAYGRD